MGLRNDSCTFAWSEFLQELSDLRETIVEQTKLQEQLAQARAEMRSVQIAKDAVVSASKQKDETNKTELAAAREANKLLQTEKAALSEQLDAAQSDVRQAAERLKQVEEQAATAETELRSTISKLQEQSDAIKSAQEQHGVAEVAKLKAEHDADVARFQNVQLRLEKEVLFIADCIRVR